ncbi:hypothetical protein V6N13_126111 [Hibiscus sabdariffa]
MRFGKKGKLSPRYIGPYEIVERVGPVAYRLLLPPELERIHDVFHVSMLRKYRSDPSHVMPIEEIELNPDLSYDEEPIEILASDSKVLRGRTIELVKVKWRHQGVEEATWERKEDMMDRYPYLFPPGNFGDGISLSGGELGVTVKWEAYAMFLMSRNRGNRFGRSEQGADGRWFGGGRMHSMMALHTQIRAFLVSSIGTEFPSGIRVSE